MFYTPFKQAAITQKSLLSHPLLINQYLLEGGLPILKGKEFKI
jgi:hypothetical protein